MQTYKITELQVAGSRKGAGEGVYMAIEVCSVLLPLRSCSAHLPPCEGGMRTELGPQGLGSLQPLTVSGPLVLGVIPGFNTGFTQCNS